MTDFLAIIENKCQYGDAKGNCGSKNKKKCGFHSLQQVFLLSHPGNNPKAKYLLNTKIYCADNNPTTLISDQYQYGKVMLSVPKDSMTKCYYDVTKKFFHIHCKKFKPLFVIDINFYISGQAPNKFCNLG